MISCLAVIKKRQNTILIEDHAKSFNSARSRDRAIIPTAIYNFSQQVRPRSNPTEISLSAAKLEDRLNRSYRVDHTVRFIEAYGN